jgi:heterogeneous nuclear ribonucleoprotein F/H
MSQDDCDKVLRVRGMPWSATQEDVVNFFEGCNVKEGGVHFLLNREGRSSGEAFVEMGKFSDFVRGLLCNKKMMGSRYIEVFESDTAEMDVILRERGMGKIVKDDKDNDDHDQKLSTEQPGVYRSGGNYIKLRGLPYSSDEVDIIEFFQGKYSGSGD